ncbi:hypothetical protein B1A99_14480 [Cohnella sp. CIP 111063]|uniref:S-layer homology domain-containing protein n=1 Tax=unclassified Cohnella TaxID=2636738 RepID=UPI000B8C6115|nr:MULTISPECIES: S-layer homology domain-containing protein [unclassified Cohnella]OXS58411.1 hypothetical protein B1A99_14480 [Cohnella sp. CIP 111063]
MTMRQGWRQRLALLLVFALAFGVAAPGGGGWSRAASAASVNLIANGDFESGNLDGWNTSGNSKFKATDSEARGGSYALEIGGPQNWNGIKYTADVEPNTNYALKFYGKGAGGAAYKVLQASDEAQLTEHYTGANDNWTLYTVEFNSGANDGVVIYLSDAGGVAFYDDFTLERVLNNLFSNGDFESGNLDGWNTGGNDKFKVTDAEARGGAYALEIGGPQNWNGIKYTVNVAPNTDYTLTFYGKGAGGAAYKVLQASDEAQITENYTGAHDDWHLYTVNFNSGANSAIIVYLSDAGGTAYYDDFYIGDPIVSVLPQASGVTIGGAAKVAGALVGSFDYAHSGGTAEGYSMYRWLQADEEDGAYAPIPRGWGQTFTLTQAQEGKYVKLEVTPVDAAGVAGEPVLGADAVGPVAAATANDWLGLRLGEASRELSAAPIGDGYAQYPLAAWNSLDEAISVAESVYTANTATQGDIDLLNAAIAAFDGSRNKKDAGFDRFVTTSGTKLMDGSDELRFISFNYPGGLYNEDEGPYGIMPTEFEMEDALRTAVQTGGQVLRTYTLTVRDKADPPHVLRHIDGPGVLNDEAFKSMDKLLELANKHGVRLIIPFIDNWDWPPGGITDFAHFRGKGRFDFYTDPQLIEDFKLVIEQVMNRVNTYTGVRYKDDPAILAWETGNELMVAPEWMSEIAAFYKSVNPNQLLVSGNQMELPHFYRNLSPQALADPNIDIVKSHYYDGNYANRVRTDKALAEAHGKPFFVGEFGFKPTSEVVSMLNETIAGGASGALIWSLRPHSAQGGFVRHSEYEVGGILYRAYHWPGMPSGDYLDATNLLRVVRDKAYEIQGKPVPPLPSPEPAPELLASDSVTKLSWLGSTGASYYTVERAESPAGPWTVVGENVLDDVEPGENMFSDWTAVTGTAYYYRVKGINASGASDYSPTLGPIAAKYVLEDDRTDESKQYYSEPGAVVYRTPSAIKGFVVDAQSAGGGEPFTFLVSDDGIAYVPVTPVRAGTEYTWTAPSVSAANHLKIVYPDGDENNGTIVRVEIEFVGDGSALTPVQPLLTSGVLTDRLDNFNSIFYREGQLAFDTATPELYGGDGSRLARGGSDEAFVVYRTQGEMKAFKLEGYYAAEPASEDAFRFYGSTDGETYSELETEVVPLGGDRFKANSMAKQLPAGIKFLKVVFPETGNPQIGGVQIAVGAGTISLPGEPPAHVIDAGDHYGGENLLLAKAYRTEPEGGVQLSLDSETKRSGEYALRLAFDLGSVSRAGIVKPLADADRSRYDTLQLWVRPDGQPRALSVALKDEAGRTWTRTFTASNVQGGYISLPLNAQQADLTTLTEFSLHVLGGTGPSAGYVHLDDIRFTQTRVIDDFEGYAGNEAAFAARYGTRNTGGGAIAASLSDEVRGGGTYSMQVDYDMTGPGYAGLITQLPSADWSAYTGLQFWIQPGPSSHKLTIQVKTGAGEYMEATAEIEGGADAHLVEIPFADFDYPSWYGGSGTLDPREILEFNMYLGLLNEPAGSFHLDDIRLTGQAGPGPNPNPNPGSGSGSGSSPGSGTADGTVAIDNPSVDASGNIAAALSDATRLTIPANASAWAQAKSLVVSGNGFSAAIPADVIRQIQSLAGAGALADSDIYFEAVPVAGANALLDQAGRKNTVGIRAAGTVYTFRIGLVGPDGKELPLERFEGGIALSFELNEGADRDLVGIYWIGADGSLEYAGGEIEGNRITVRVRHFSAYAPLEYRKTFADVKSGHWAADVIAKVAAKHIVQGVSATEFAPSRSVTRAEFAAFLARALKLEASGAAPFADVAAGKWYAGVVAAASEAGIVQGRTADRFAPDETITREEMAVMIVRAYERRTGAKASGQPDAPFADASEVSGWAAASVDAASALGLIQGKGGSRFDPKGSQLRSESAQVIWNLLTR